jgi:hypothetical protein
MPTHLRRPFGALLACCAAALTFTSAAEAANKAGASLRVIDSAGRTLAEHHQYTGTTRVRTTPAADCFGAGTEGSGAKFRLGGPSATGILGDASAHQRKLRPLRLTDAFFPDFGLGVCSIGGRSEPNGFWYLKYDHVGATVSGDLLPIKGGGSVLWYLIDDFNDPAPAELRIRASSTVEKGELIEVSALEYDDSGNSSPAAGVGFAGTDVVTGADGEALLPARGALTRLRGRRDGAIPSNRLEVCRLQEAGGCPVGHELDVRGTDKRDLIRLGKRPAAVNAYAGRDRIDIRKLAAGIRPLVRCGAGKDVVVARAGQKLTARKSCEKIRRR